MFKLAHYLKPYRLQVILGPIFKLIEAIFELIIPIVTAQIIDRGVKTGDVGYVWRMDDLAAFLQQPVARLGATTITLGGVLAGGAVLFGLLLLGLAVGARIDLAKTAPRPFAPTRWSRSPARSSACRSWSRAARTSASSG